MARWSAAQVATLQRHREAGLSWRDCSRKMRRSRNSCIGKGRRAGHTPMQPSEIQKTNEWAMRQAWALSRREAPPPPPVEGHNVLAFVPHPSRKPVPILALKSTSCRWPLGDPREKEFGFCGQTQCEESAYCAEHHAVAYGPRAKAA